MESADTKLTFPPMVVTILIITRNMIYGAISTPPAWSLLLIIIIRRRSKKSISFGEGGAVRQKAHLSSDGKKSKLATLVYR